LAFLGVAFAAGGDKVAVGIIPGLRERDDVVETFHVRGELAETVETMPCFARMDGVAQDIRAEKVLFFQVGGGSWPRVAVPDMSGLARRNFI